MSLFYESGFLTDWLDKEGEISKKLEGVSVNDKRDPIWGSRAFHPNSCQLLFTLPLSFFKCKIWFTSKEKILIARLGTWLRNVHIFGGKLVYTNLSSNIVLSQKVKKLSCNMTHKCNPISDDCIQCIRNLILRSYQ